MIKYKLGDDIYLNGYSAELYIHSDVLLHHARNVFGNDIIDYAYIVIDYYNNDDRYSKEYVLNEFNKQESFIDSLNNSLRYDTVQIALTFINGRTVLFTASEWAHISEVN